MWKVIPLLLVLPSVLGVSLDTAVVTSTKEFRSALYDTRITVIYLQHSFSISSEEWGFVRPNINRRVVIRPATSGAKLILDLGSATDLAFVGAPSGELHFHDLQIRGAYHFPLASSGTVSVLASFHLNAGQSIHLHNVTCCIPETVCSAFSNDLRGTISSTEQVWDSLGVASCLFERDKAFQEAIDTFLYSEGCVFPQEWKPNTSTGSIYVHNTTTSCATECKSSAEPEPIPVVKVSTADSRQVLAAIGNLLYESQELEIQLLGRVVIYEHKWSRTFWLPIERSGTKASIDGLLENGNHATLVFSIDDFLIRAFKGFSIQLTNMVLEMERFGPGFLSKADWPILLRGGEDYFYEWPLFLPYIFVLHNSWVQMANVTLVYNTCPSNIDFDRFIASTDDFKADFDNRDFGVLEPRHPSFSISKFSENGVVFHEFNASFPTFLLEGDTWTPSYLNDFELENVTVVCNSFVDTVDVAGCNEAGSSEGSEGQLDNCRESAQNTSFRSENGPSVKLLRVELWAALVLTTVLLMNA